MASQCLTHKVRLKNLVTTWMLVLLQTASVIAEDASTSKSINLVVLNIWHVNAARQLQAEVRLVLLLVTWQLEATVR